MLGSILQYALKKHGSDIHIISGQKPIIRLAGDLVRMEGDVLTADQVEKMVRSLLNERQFAEFKACNEVDFAFELKSHIRFRANAFKTINGPAMALRPINENTKEMSELGVPGVVTSLLQKRKGLMLVSGPTGSGKSTTLAAMIDYINTHYSCNIITIEDPVEYVHKSKKSLISQREVGVHTNSFANALKAALRENPDIILVGELRDVETFSLALTAAETGHLVLGTMHTSSAATAVSRIVDVFPAQEQAMARSMLSNSLNAVILQRLLKTKDGSGRCAAFEVMVGNNSVRNLIRENKLAQLNSTMEIGKKYGMITMKDSIAALAETGRISEEQAGEYLRSFVSSE